MTQTLTRTSDDKVEAGIVPFLVKLDPIIKLTGKQFADFCAMNDDFRIELTAEGLIEIMPPAFGNTSRKNNLIGIHLGNWTLQDGSGVSFDSSGGFTLPNRAVRSPDASWVSNSRYDALTAEEKGSFTPLCPDFVIELRSSSDRLSVLQAKMEEYMANGAQLGWLLDPLQRQAHVYRPDTDVVILDNPDTLSADPELPGFTLDLKPIWDPAF